MTYSNTSYPIHNAPRLKGLIKERGDSQANLAKALGIARTTLNRKLNGKDGACLTCSEIYNIVKIYEIPVTERANLFFMVS